MPDPSGGTNPAVSASVKVSASGALSKSDQVERIIQRHAKYAAGVGVAVGFVPIPILDLAAVGGLQFKMVKEIAELHDSSLKGNKIKTVVGAALGALLPLRLGYGGVGALVSSIPGGSLLSLATVPAFNYASTVAVGRVFHKHFATGGEFLTLDTSMKDDLFAEYRKAYEKYKPARA